MPENRTAQDHPAIAINADAAIPRQQTAAAQAPAKHRRRMARDPMVAIIHADGTMEADGNAINTAPTPEPSSPRPPSKLDRLAALLVRDEGASLPELMTVTGWQAHSVRGAMAGALRKRGWAVTSTKPDGQRRYHAQREA